MTPGMQFAFKTIEAELKQRIHTAAMEAVKLAGDIEKIAKATDEELVKAHTAIAHSAQLLEAEARDAAAKLASLVKEATPPVAP